MFRRLLLSLTLILVCLSGCTTLQQAADIQKPSASVGAVSLGKISLNEVTLLVDLELTNPNPISLKADGFNLDLFINDQLLTNIAKQDEKINLVVNSTETLQLPVTFQFEEVSALLSSFSDQNELEYEILGSVLMDIPVLKNMELPVAYQGSLPIPKLPAVQFKGLKLDSIDWSGANLTLDLAVSNPNSFNLDIQSLSYQLQSGDKAFSSGALETMSLTSGENQDISIPLSVSLTNMGIKLFRLLYGGEAIEVDFNGEAKVVPEIGVWQPDAIKFSGQKTLKP